ncbi:Zinc finger CCCH domain-containing protein 7 [Gossypium australe]|uniref:Zinc finger CCCH domain-containing protein 7 n=1 Tax=Gossypium australe TaxID=47621 RepID=A0A5B6VI16_9ROSI|nr:Zinc finger CCCH domain-containing protein 7 [Gossypium australe]
MGFKDLVLFNKALLAKQIWRILTQPKCLLAKVLKARYYPHSDILTANVGSYPSFTWRSICSARELVENGLLWWVGSGPDINIWNDPWLPGKENNRVSIQQIFPNWTTVNQLIICGTFTWNEELLYNIFDADTVKRILSIPIAGGRSEDLRVWKYEGSGEYTVKSGYRVLSTEHLQNTTVTISDGVIESKFYNSLWALHIPAKIKIYIWRLSNNFLPHLCNLVRRKLCVEIVCPLCKKGPEDADYLMWSCEVLQSVWKSLNIMVPSYDPSTGGNFGVSKRNSAGDIVGAETYLFKDVTDAFMAEARACERALILAAALGFRRVIVEGDSLTVIKSIKKRQNEKSILRPITQHILSLETGFEEIYLFIPRLVNNTAHTLAMEGRRRHEFRVWCDEVPESVQTSALKDCEAWNHRP